MTEKTFEKELQNEFDALNGFISFQIIKNLKDKYCLDKQKVKDAIEKHMVYNLDHQHRFVDYEDLKKELSLDGEK